MVDREPLALIIVRVENTKTIYWNDLNGDHGGYGITEVSLIKIIAENESMKKIGFLSDAGNLMFWEPYTISVDGSIIYPMYTYQQFSERLFETREINPIMKSGNYYLIAFNAGRFLTSEYESVCYRCYMNENAELGDGSGVRINNKDCPIYNKYRDTFFSPLMSIYEFDTEAFERSAEIVAQYEREGKTRTDGTYYLYHAMVVDGWNLYKGVLESVPT